MTDLEKFVDLYKSFGVECKINQDENTDRLYIVFGESNYDDGEFTLSDKFKGYCGFYTQIWFTQDGNFLEQGFWE